MMIKESYNLYVPPPYQNMQDPPLPRTENFQEMTTQVNQFYILIFKLINTGRRNLCMVWI